MRYNVGIRVPSNPKNKPINLFEENVIIKNTSMAITNKINFRFSLFLFFWRWEIFARRATGINQRLRAIRGLLYLSVNIPHERFFE